MNKLIDILKKYFENTPESKIKAEWGKYAEYDQVGPKIDDFLFHLNLLHQTQKEPDYWFIKTKNENLKNPKFSSDFFIKCI